MIGQVKELHSVDDVVVMNLPFHNDDNGDLIVMQGSSHVPFDIARVFVVRAKINAIRGQHAHKDCSQFLTSPRGCIEVVCDDGSDTVTYIIDSPDIGLLIPPGIWAQEKYLTHGSVLTVLCDRPYEALDYIRDYDEFIKYRKHSELMCLKQEKR